MSNSTYRARRIGRDARALAAELEADEPRTTRLISDVLTYRRRGWRRAWRIDGPDGRLAGAVVLAKLCFDRWTASVYLRDPEAAPVAAALLDRSRAWNAMGPAVDIRPLLPHLRRTRRVLVSPWLIAPHPVPDILGPPDDRTRAATLLDLEELVDLYAGYEVNWPLTRWQLREHLRRQIDRHVVIVCEAEGRVVGAVAIDGRTRRYATSMDLTVDPAFRREGIGWELAKRMRLVGVAMAVGGWGALAPSNPMHREDEGLVWDPDHFYKVMLGAPRRFKGQTRLRRLYGRIQPLTARTAQEFRDPADPDRPPPDAG